MTDYEFRSRRQRAVDLDMVEVCRRLGIALSPRGAWRQGRCPNPGHDDHHPSFGVKVRTNRFCCFSCGWHGDNITLVSTVLHCTYTEAVDWLLGTTTTAPATTAARCQPVPADGKDDEWLDLEHLRNLVSPREYYKCLSPWARDFLRQRRIEPNLIDAKAIVSIDRRVAISRTKRIGSGGKPYTPTFPAPALLLPYRDHNGVIINIQARVHQPAPGQRRFHFPPGSHTSLWNPRDALILPDGADLWLCEGVSDALALITSGRPALAIASATCLTTSAASFIAQQGTRLHLHIYPDNDGPGEALYQRLLPSCPTLRRHQLPLCYKDFGEAWADKVVEVRRG